MINVLAIETSCDETAVAVLSDTKEVLFNELFSQDHSHYGGVVPELASRNHLMVLEKMVRSAISEADFTHVAVTAGPGLIGGVIVGVMMAKAIASASGKNLLAINHLEGHVLSVCINNSVEFPFLALLISGGHCQFVIAEDVGRYRVIGKTLDDSLGESFDKVAKMLDLKYPGGPEIERLAKQGNKDRFSLVKPMYRRDGCDFSFSGLKTTIKRLITQLGSLTQEDKCDLCASFQRVVCEILLDRISHASKIFNRIDKHFVIVGGVAANSYLRENIKRYVEGKNMIFASPPINLCTDNALMIAWAALEHLRKAPKTKTSLDFIPKARWPLA